MNGPRDHFHRDRRDALETRRGAALLVVLSVFALVVTSCATLAQVMATARAQRDIHLCTALAHDRAEACRSRILHWLEQDSREVVLGPDVEVPRVDVLHHQMAVSGRAEEIHLTAWDQSGMAPVGLVGRGSPLRVAVPDRVLEVFDAVEGGTRITGLDEIGAAGGDGATFPGTGVGVALGAHLGVHNAGIVNVNTAPRRLLEEALRRAGRGGVESILGARAQGKRATVASAPSEPRRQGSPLRFADHSRCWSLRIDVRVGAVRRSWWSVHRQTPTGWREVQRLEIR